MAELLPGHRAGLSPEPAGRYDLAGFVGPELPDVPALADVVISRSGAGTPAELTALGKSALSVPLAPSAGDEQAHNARHLQEAGIGIALEGDVTADQVRTAWGPLLADAHLRRRGPGRRHPRLLAVPHPRTGPTTGSHQHRRTGALR
ncbi:hypothetical protein JK361_29950 [Streptomyces sp. 5-8]|uniref:Glycosyl transferase family 28 C-terminal domain-containing protein n=1 Tax=Streptomyces musisoli TaxID=2802280 RepID=A0ABS1P9B4_9ACTN|nr:hypothetical protein [Streptomyces musisoli]